MKTAKTSDIRIAEALERIATSMEIQIKFFKAISFSFGPHNNNGEPRPRAIRINDVGN